MLYIVGEKRETREGRYESVEAFRAAHPGYQIESINDEFVVAFCEGCDRPLFEETQYVLTVDDCYLCPECATGAATTDTTDSDAQ